MTTANIISQQDIVARPAIAIYNPVFGIDIFCMTITDPNIRQQAQTVKVIFQDGQEKTVPIQNQGDMVISRKSDKENPHVDAVFYDSNQKQILKVLFWGGTEVRAKSGSTTGTFTSQATRLSFGATNGNAIDATFDDIRLDTAVMP